MELYDLLEDATVAWEEGILDGSAFALRVVNIFCGETGHQIPQDIGDAACRILEDGADIGVAELQAYSATLARTVRDWIDNTFIPNPDLEGVDFCGLYEAICKSLGEERV